MYQQHINHPDNKVASALDAGVLESMYQLFVHICQFWDNLDTPEKYKSRLFAFMENRIRLHPQYTQHYIVAKQTIDRLIDKMGEEAAYEYLFTFTICDQTPPDLTMTREQVSNEFIAFQVSQGGFKKFGPKNSLGYIGGAYIPGEPAPYRTAKE